MEACRGPQNYGVERARPGSVDHLTWPPKSPELRIFDWAPERASLCEQGARHPEVVGPGPREREELRVL